MIKQGNCLEKEIIHRIMPGSREGDQYIIARNYKRLAWNCTVAVIRCRTWCIGMTVPSVTISCSSTVEQRRLRSQITACFKHWIRTGIVIRLYIKDNPC